MTKDNRPATGMLAVLGARIHYELQGSGPLLVIIPGGAADGEAFSDLADELATHYTVLSYDPRGLGRSVLDGQPEPVSVSQQADDLGRLLASVGNGPAYAFASSAGGMTGLDLIIRSPHLVRTLLLHEPPITELLPERADHRQQSRKLYETWRAHGTDAAIATFLADSGIGEGDEGGEGGEGGGFEDVLKGMRSNFGFFIGYLSEAVAAYLPDIEALRTSPTTLVITAGEKSVGQIAHRAASALAEALGRPLISLPGDHTGTPDNPAEFALAVHEQLAR